MLYKPCCTIGCYDLHCCFRPILDHKITTMILHFIFTVLNPKLITHFVKQVQKPSTALHIQWGECVRFLVSLHLLSWMIYDFLQKTKMALYWLGLCLNASLILIRISGNMSQPPVHRHLWNNGSQQSLHNSVVRKKLLWNNYEEFGLNKFDILGDKTSLLLVFLIHVICE